MFSNKDLKNLIVPLFLEQLLMALVGIADVFVSGFVGEAAVSGVSLVNSFNTMFINLFTTLASDGAVVISQYIGKKRELIMKKNIGAQLALYPAPVIVVGAIVNDKPTWTLVAHAGTMAHSHLMVSLVYAHYINQEIIESKKLSVNIVDEAWLKEADRMGVISGNKEDKSESGKIDYHTFKPVLFEFPTYEYFVTGEKVGDCAKMN